MKNGLRKSVRKVVGRLGEETLRKLGKNSFMEKDYFNNFKCRRDLRCWRSVNIFIGFDNEEVFAF